MEENKQEEIGGISLRDIINSIKAAYKYIWSKWLVIALGGVLGVSIGLGLYLLRSINFISKITFVVEESKSSAGGLAALAGQFGFDIGGSSGGGIFAGDNILLFLKSENLCKEVLLTYYDSTNTKTLADAYAESNDLKKKWSKKATIGDINFAVIQKRPFNRVEDSLLHKIITGTDGILAKGLTVGRPDKKASFIEVRAIMKDELLSKLFSERLVKIATKHYVESKIKIKAANVAQLQRRADSLAALLNNKTFSAAANQQELVDVNPALRFAPISAEISVRDKTMIATIFGEVVKNLELSKMMLNQETPVIQMVDISGFPLEREELKKTKAFIIGGFFGSFFVIVFLLIRRWLKSLV